MTTMIHRLTLTLILLSGLPLTAFAEGPLKVYILAGQSNMQGMAQLSTVPRMALSPKTKALHDKVLDKEGNPQEHKNVSIVFFTGGSANVPRGRDG